MFSFSKEVKDGEGALLFPMKIVSCHKYLQYNIEA